MLVKRRLNFKAENADNKGNMLFNFAYMYIPGKDAAAALSLKESARSFYENR